MTAGPGVLVIGAGGHALVSVEVLRSAGAAVAGCLARDLRSAAGLRRLGVAMLGSDADIERTISRGTPVFVAVGDNLARRDLTARAVAAGGLLVSAVSPSATVSATASVGAGALVMPGSVVNALAEVGTGVIVNTAGVIEHECQVEAFAHVAPGAALAGKVTVGEGAMLGLGSRVLPGLRVGSWATVGAGAVVVEDVPDGATVVGVPARRVDLQ